MEMRIVVPEAASTSVLAERLSSAFGATGISLLHDQRGVGIKVDGDSDRAVLRVLDTVEGWLGRARSLRPAAAHKGGSRLWSNRRRRRWRDFR